MDERKFGQYIIPWKRLCVCLSVCVWRLTVHCTLRASDWEFPLSFTNSHVHWCTDQSKHWDTGGQLVKGSVIYAGWSKVKHMSLVSLCVACIASWLANPRLSSSVEWISACLTPAPQAHKLAPSPNLSWHWCRQTWPASCLLQRDKQNYPITISILQR